MNRFYAIYGINDRNEDIMEAQMSWVSSDTVENAVETILEEKLNLKNPDIGDWFDKQDNTSYMYADDSGYYVHIGPRPDHVLDSYREFI